MSTAIDYPEGLPSPLRAGYGLEHVSPVLRTTLSTGRARQRRLYTSVPSLVTVSWLLSDVQAQVFEGWFRWALVDGQSWFNCRLRTPIGHRPYQCRFVGMYRGPALVGANNWRFEAELEIFERQTIDAGMSAHPSLVLNQSLIDTTINREWPQ